MRIALAVAAVVVLAACSRTDDPKVARADADLKATGAAATNLAAAAARDTRATAAVAADKTGAALQDAGAKVKQAGDDAERKSGD